MGTQKQNNNGYTGTEEYDIQRNTRYGGTVGQEVSRNTRPEEQWVQRNGGTVGTQE